MDHKNYLSNNMSLPKLMKITGSVSLVTMLALSGRGVTEAQEINEFSSNRLNLEPININYNDTASIADLAKDILKDEVSMLSEIMPIEKDQFTDTYSLGDYIIKVNFDKKSGLGLKDVKISIEDKFTASRKDKQKISLLGNVNKPVVVNGIVNEYNVKVNIVDTTKPVIKLTKSSVTINSNDEFDIKKYIESVTDNYDGKLDYKVEGKLDTQGLEYKPGTYKFTISATDSSGNNASEELNVTVKKKTYRKNGDTSKFKGTSYIVNAAYAQLGEKQDCTRLVSDSLLAAGINFHGWPIEYFSLGYEIPASQAKAGDLIYYANGGGGLAHIAVYVGNGMSIHGGWHGNTVLYRYNYSTASTPRFIRIVKN